MNSLYLGNFMFLLAAGSANPGVFQSDFMFYTLIGINLALMIKLFSSYLPQPDEDADKKKIAEQLAAWLAPQGNYTKEELQPAFLLLLQGKKSDLLSEVILGLRSEYKEVDLGRYSHDIKVYYQKGEDVFQTTFSQKVEWEDVPQEVRHEMNRRNSETLVFDYLKQAVVEEKVEEK